MQNKKKLVFLSIFILLVIIVIVYISYLINRNPLYVNVSKIDVNVEVERFDLEFEAASQGDVYSNIQALSKKYNNFFTVYNSQIIEIGSIENSSYSVYLNTFLNDYSVFEAKHEVNKVFPDLNQINKDLTYCFRHYKYYYPEYEMPRFVSFIAGFNHSIVLLDGFIGIGLDKYLGTENEVYRMLNIPQYTRFEMKPDQIAVDIMRAIAENTFEYKPETENLLNNMIYNGKILYFLDAMMPEFDEARKNKYTYEQMNFCYRFEKDMWTDLIENKLLFTTDYFTIRKFTQNSPYTPQFGTESPPRAVNWIGLQIVRSYMEHNKDVTLQELMTDDNYQKILNFSQYSPR